MWYQTELSSGNTFQICWLEQKLKVGAFLTLEDDVRVWKVTIQYQIPQEPVRRRWNVGGIESELN